VTALSPTNVWAVGEDLRAGSATGGNTLIEHYNGTAWSIVPSPTPGADPSLGGVAGRSASDVYAVGSNVTADRDLADVCRPPGAPVLNGGRDAEQGPHGRQSVAVFPS